MLQNLEVVFLQRRREPFGRVAIGEEKSDLIATVEFDSVVLNPNGAIPGKLKICADTEELHGRFFDRER